MALSRGERVALGVAGAVALAMPVWLLRAPAASPVPDASPASVLAVPRPPPLSAVYGRSLFASDGGVEEDAALPADAPQLIGIAGRIGRDAVALVRGGDGSGRTLRIGEAVDGWTLESLAIDAAFFTRGSQRLRVPLPAG